MVVPAGAFEHRGGVSRILDEVVQTVLQAADGRLVDNGHLLHRAGALRADVLACLGFASGRFGQLFDGHPAGMLPAAAGLRLSIFGVDRGKSLCCNAGDTGQARVLFTQSGKYRFGSGQPLRLTSNGRNLFLSLRPNFVSLALLLFGSAAQFLLGLVVAHVLHALFGQGRQFSALLGCVLRVLDQRAEPQQVLLGDRAALLLDGLDEKGNQTPQIELALAPDGKRSRQLAHLLFGLLAQGDFLLESGLEFGVFSGKVFGHDSSDIYGIFRP